MTCERCGHDVLRVVSTVRRFDQADIREVECTFCKQRYSTTTRITDAVIYDRGTMSSSLMPIDKFKNHVQETAKAFEHIRELRLFD